MSVSKEYYIEALGGVYGARSLIESSCWPRVGRTGFTADQWDVELLRELHTTYSKHSTKGHTKFRKAVSEAVKRRRATPNAVHGEVAEALPIDIINASNLLKYDNGFCRVEIWKQDEVKVYGAATAPVSTENGFVEQAISGHAPTEQLSTVRASPELAPSQQAATKADADIVAPPTIENTYHSLRNVGVPSPLQGVTSNAVDARSGGPTAHTPTEHAPTEHASIAQTLPEGRSIEHAPTETAPTKQVRTNKPLPEQVWIEPSIKTQQEHHSYTGWEDLRLKFVDRGKPRTANGQRVKIADSPEPPQQNELLKVTQWDLDLIYELYVLQSDLGREAYFRIGFWIWVAVRWRHQAEGVSDGDVAEMLPVDIMSARDRYRIHGNTSIGVSATEKLYPKHATVAQVSPEGRSIEQASIGLCVGSAPIPTVENTPVSLRELRIRSRAFRAARAKIVLGKRSGGGVTKTTTTEKSLRRTQYMRPSDAKIDEIIARSRRVIGERYGGLKGGSIAGDNAEKRAIPTTTPVIRPSAAALAAQDDKLIARAFKAVLGNVWQRRRG